MANILKGGKARVLDAAIQCAEEDGWHYVTREKVAQLAGVATGTVNNTLGNVTEMKDAVMNEAVKRGLLPIVADGLAYGNPIARGAPEELKKKVAEYLIHSA
jgi:AcrR family transcriptional regulator